MVGESEGEKTNKIVLSQFGLHPLISVELNKKLGFNIRGDLKTIYVNGISAGGHNGKIFGRLRNLNVLEFRSEGTDRELALKCPSFFAFAILSLVAERVGRTCSGSSIPLAR